MLKVAVIGTGYLGWHHARIYADLPQTKLVAVVDTDPQRAKDTALKFDCHYFTDYHDVIPHVDAVSIASPTPTHFEIAKTLMLAHKHILLEKPVTLTLSQADELINLHRQHPHLCIQAGHLERFNPIIQAMSDKIATPAFFISERLSPFTGRSADVDITIDLMIHDIDILMSLYNCDLQDVQITHAVGSDFLTGSVDMAEAWLTICGRYKARLTASRVSPVKQRLLKLFKQHEVIYVDLQTMSAELVKAENGSMLITKHQADVKEPLKEEIADFVQSILTNKASNVPLKAGRDALSIALKISDEIKKSLIYLK